MCRSCKRDMGCRPAHAGSQGTDLSNGTNLTIAPGALAWQLPRRHSGPADVVQGTVVGGAKPKGVGQAAANPYLHLLQQYMEALLPRGSGRQLSLPAQMSKRPGLHELVWQCAAVQLTFLGLLGMCLAAVVPRRLRLRLHGLSSLWGASWSGGSRSTRPQLTLPTACQSQQQVLICSSPSRDSVTCRACSV